VVLVRASLLALRQWLRLRLRLRLHSLFPEEQLEHKPIWSHSNGSLQRLSVTALSNGSLQRLSTTALSNGSLCQEEQESIWSQIDQRTEWALDTGGCLESTISFEQVESR
jgi:hypothetical protein